MPYGHEDFVYAADLSLRVNGASFYCRVPGDIGRRDELFAVLRRALWMPDATRFDWDALFDGLCDLSWMTDRKVMLVHDRLPRLPDRELRLYLSILTDAVRWWRFDDPHAFEVVFPAAQRERIESLLAH